MSRKGSVEQWLPAAIGWVLVAAFGARFWLPALRALPPGLVRWPVPLDDSYIYFGFARSTALGQPFSWIPGNGYSSGATSVIYPFLLAPLWAIGMRGSWLGLGAALIAVAALVDLSGSLARIARARAGMRILPPVVVLSLPLLDWSWFSGMETAVFGAALGRALLFTQRCIETEPHDRRRAQLVAGCWLAVLPLARPEAIVLAFCLSIAIAHAAGSLAAWPTLGRSAGPTAGTLLVQTIVNKALTGEWQPAGAVQKLLANEPFTSAAGAAIEWFKNAVVLAHEAGYRAFGGAIGLGAHAALWACALCLPGRRRLGGSLAAGALGSALLACLASTARYQNYRYAAPALAMLLGLSWLGFAALASARLGAASLLLSFAFLAPFGQLDRQVAHFVQACVNIAEQQGGVARLLAAMTPRPRRVLVNDAGAIPYLSQIPAIDGLGLGGFRGLPFARASLYGPAAVIELIERLPAAERPDLMALYPSWWPGLTDRFGARIGGVRIDHNVICAADEQVIYRADWSLSAPSGSDSPPATADRLDLGDLVDEAAHDVAFRENGSPRDFPVVGAVHALNDGSARWDGGRVIGPGAVLSFRARARAGLLALRNDASADPGLAISVVHEGSNNRAEQHGCSAVFRSGGAGAWSVLLAKIDILQGDRVSLRPKRELRAFALWLTRP